MSQPLTSAATGAFEGASSNGTAADDELVRLQRLGDAAGFAARIKELYETERRFEAPGLWGRFHESRVSPRPVGQLSALLVNAKKGDLRFEVGYNYPGNDIYVEGKKYVDPVETEEEGRSPCPPSRTAPPRPQGPVAARASGWR